MSPIRTAHSWWCAIDYGDPRTRPWVGRYKGVASVLSACISSSRKAARKCLAYRPRRHCYVAPIRWTPGRAVVSSAQRQRHELQKSGQPRMPSPPRQDNKRSTKEPNHALPNMLKRMLSGSLRRHIPRCPRTPGTPPSHGWHQMTRFFQDFPPGGALGCLDATLAASARGGLEMCRDWPKCRLGDV
jgi:hypothetical protein